MSLQLPIEPPRGGFSLQGRYVWKQRALSLFLSLLAGGFGGLMLWGAWDLHDEVRRIDGLWARGEVAEEVAVVATTRRSQRHGEARGALLRYRLPDGRQLEHESAEVTDAALELRYDPVRPADAITSWEVDDAAWNRPLALLLAVLGLASLGGSIPVLRLGLRPLRRVRALVADGRIDAVGVVELQERTQNGVRWMSLKLPGPRGGKPTGQQFALDDGGPWFVDGGRDAVVALVGDAGAHALRSDGYPLVGLGVGAARDPARDAARLQTERRALGFGAGFSALGLVLPAIVIPLQSGPPAASELRALEGAVGQVRLDNAAVHFSVAGTPAKFVSKGGELRPVFAALAHATEARVRCAPDADGRPCTALALEVDGRVLHTYDDVVASWVADDAMFWWVDAIVLLPGLGLLGGGLLMRRRRTRAPA